jgi:hypothetical protein
MDWDLLNKIAIIVTILWIPSIFILYLTLWSKLKELLRFNKNKYISKRLSWKITFDYSNNNWIYQIWKDNQFFEIKFTKASDVSIHIYNDPPSIEWVAIVNWIYDISNIKNASIFDMSSRTRTPKKWEIVILKNKYWNFCALKITDIKDNSRTDEKDEITFEYVINGDWYTDFRK